MQEEAKKEEAVIKKTESANKNDNISPQRPSYTDALSENLMVSAVSREESRDESDPIKQLLGDEDITSLKTLNIILIFFFFFSDISDYIIDYSYLKFGSQIGAGSTSVVFLGRLKNEDVGIHSF